MRDRADMQDMVAENLLAAGWRPFLRARIKISPDQAPSGELPWPYDS